MQLFESFRMLGLVVLRWFSPFLMQETNRKSYAFSCTFGEFCRGFRSWTSGGTARKTRPRWSQIDCAHARGRWRHARCILYPCNHTHLYTHTHTHKHTCLDWNLTHSFSHSSVIQRLNRYSLASQSDVSRDRWELSPGHNSIPLPSFIHRHPGSVPSIHRSAACVHTWTRLTTPSPIFRTGPLAVCLSVCLPDSFRSRGIGWGRVGVTLPFLSCSLPQHRGCRSWVWLDWLPFGGLSGAGSEVRNSTWLRIHRSRAWPWMGGPNGPGHESSTD